MFRSLLPLIFCASAFAQAPISTMRSEKTRDGMVFIEERTVSSAGTDDVMHVHVKGSRLVVEIDADDERPVEIHVVCRGKVLRTRSITADELLRESCNHFSIRQSPGLIYQNNGLSFTTTPAYRTAD